MKRAAIYLRVSTMDQNYDRQERELKVLAESLGYEIKYVFEEKRSAVLSMDTREQLTQLRKLTRNDIDTIFVWDISRLARKAIDFINLVNEFSDKQICIYFKDRNIVTLEEDGKLNPLTGMYLYLLGVFAQMEAENIKSRMLSGKEKALAEGKSYTNIAPFGYYLENKHLYIKEEEAKYIRIAFELYKDGKDTQYIADMFNAENVPLKSGRKDIIWVKGTISQLLNNTVYYGKGKRETTSTVKKQIRYFDSPAIISKELFDKCREVASRNSCRQDKSSKRTNLLRGLLICGLCGKYYVLGNNNKKQEYRDGDIRANANNRLGCKNGALNVEIADKLIWEAIRNVYEYNTFRKKTLEEKDKIKSEIAVNQERIENLMREVYSFENQIDKLYNLFLKEYIDENEFLKRKISIDSDKQRIEMMMLDLKTKNFLLVDKLNANFDYSIINRDLSIEEKKEVCNELIEFVRIYSYGMYKKLLHVKLKIGLETNILVDTSSNHRYYFIVDDNVVTFCDKFNLPSRLSDDIKAEIPDFQITSANNELFEENIFGGYSYDEIFDIAKKYGYVKFINDLLT
ncbi:recombinase family protein [Bacteroides sp. 51]|uniref:recombinase family protein n=1 Tax=Bacteroides sp. 51 TaxID=2302938 RepID=UPI002105BB92|nr:recombinase family protein [Bacteroides sp. 51]NDV84810.1 recombinase family protein [Bacteroides sp. 51]